MPDRVPLDSETEGVVIRALKPGEEGWTEYPTSYLYGLSTQKVETIDLLSEGPIKGLVSGEYTYSGVLGEVGWRRAEFNYFPFPKNDPTLSWLKSVYWNDVPILDDKGLYNFQDIDVKYTLGQPNGEIIQTLSPYEQASRNIGEKLYGGPENAKIYRILNELCRGVIVNIRIAGLSRTRDDTGQIFHDLLDYNIYYKPVFNSAKEVDWILAAEERLDAKITKNAYIRNTLIQFDDTFRDNKDFMGWEIKIVKLTLETTEAFKTNITYVDSLTEVQGNIFTFPYCAVTKCLFNAEFFQSIPERAFDVELMKVKIPGNYNTVLRTYSGEGFATTNGGWDGTFATGKHYTNNPAWCYYDLLTNKRYGLGKYINESYVDKWNLYNIAKYCDTLVSDGYGGLEPRFTCNLWITSREEAYKVVNDMASIFRGLTYYSNGSIQAIQDSPKNANVAFTNANVEDGNFNYQSTSKKARHSIAIVRYNDPKNFYRPAVEYVENLDAIKKYGINEVELTAVGTASRGQAIRLGRWALLSDNLESEIIAFNAGLEAAFLRPGDIFKVFDANKKTKRFGGRTLSFQDIDTTGTRALLDYSTEFEPNIEYKISFLTPSYAYNEYLISDLSSSDFSGEYHRNFLQSFTFSGWQAENSGNKTILHFSGGMNYDDFIVTGASPWVIELAPRYENYSGLRYFTDTDYDYFRVINIKEEDSNKFAVEGLQYNPQKFVEIDSGILFGRDIYNIDKNRVPATPYNFQSTISLLTTNTRAIDYSFSIPSKEYITEYQVYIRTGDWGSENIPDKQFLVHRLPPEQLAERYLAQDTGVWNFRIYSWNGVDNLYSAGYAAGQVNIYEYDYIKDVYISNLKIKNDGSSYTGNAINKNVTFVENNDANPTFTWQVGFEDGALLNENELNFRITVRPYSPSNSRIPIQDIYHESFYVTGTEWLFALDTNINSSGGPHRNYQVVVEAHDKNGKTSAGNYLESDLNKWHANPFGYDILNVENPRTTGIELEDNIPTFRTGTVIAGVGSFLNYNGSNTSLTTGAQTYADNLFIGANGEIVIEYTSGEFDADLVGGYVYVSEVEFPKEEAAKNVGFWGATVTKAAFSFDPTDPYIYHPSAANRLRFFPSGFVAVSFYDELDGVLKEEGIDISTGLYVSNLTVAQRNLGGGGISVPNPSGIDISLCSTVYYESIGTDMDFSTVLVTSSGQYGDLIIVHHTCPDNEFSIPLGTTHYAGILDETPLFPVWTNPSNLLVTWAGAVFTAATGIEITHIGAYSYESYYNSSPSYPSTSEYARTIKLVSGVGDVGDYEDSVTWPVVATNKVGWATLTEPVKFWSGDRFTIVREEYAGNEVDGHDGTVYDPNDTAHGVGEYWSGEHISGFCGFYRHYYDGGSDFAYTGTSTETTSYSVVPVAVRYNTFIVEE